MNILSILKALAGAITAAFLAITGSGAVPQPAQVQEIASTTDAVVTEAIRTAATTTPDDVQQAYELGKQIGQMQAKADQITSTTTTTMAPAQPPAPAPAIGNGAAPAQATPAPTVPTAASAPAPTAPASLARIDVINPIAGKGVRPGISTKGDMDERGNPSNEVVVGAVVYGDDGQPTDSATVTVAPTDAGQGKTIVGTGDVTPIYVNGERRLVPVYMFTYEVKASGPNEIAFSALGTSGKVGFDAK